MLKFNIEEKKNAFMTYDRQKEGKKKERKQRRRRPPITMEGNKNKFPAFIVVVVNE